MDEDWKKNWGSKLANPVRECVVCEGKYAPSMTSHPTKCGICAPYKRFKHSRANQSDKKEIAIPKQNYVFSRAPSLKDPKLPVGTNFCKCSACGEYFGGVTAFDLHRVGRAGSSVERACLAPSDVSDRKKRPLLSLNNRGYWVRTYKEATATNSRNNINSITEHL